MNHIITLLSFSALLFSLSASQRVLPSDENGFPNIKPIAVEYEQPNTDKDGVFDFKDKCPNTPLGTLVDENGCQLDDDKDGVVNSVDECPTTPESRVVDEKGCQLDSDNDGVIDFIDQCPNTSEGFKVNSIGCTLSAILKVNFNTNKYNVKDEYKEEINKFAQFLNDNNAYNVVISGHTDSIGDDASNQILSENRAEAVMRKLVSLGIDSSRITAIGEGETKPIADNATVEGRSQNRRIEAKLVTSNEE